MIKLPTGRCRLNSTPNTCLFLNAFHIARSPGVEHFLNLRALSTKSSLYGSNGFRSFIFDPPHVPLQGRETMFSSFYLYQRAFLSLGEELKARLIMALFSLPFLPPNSFPVGNKNECFIPACEVELRSGLLNSLNGFCMWVTEAVSFCKGNDCYFRCYFFEEF